MLDRVFAPRTRCGPFLAWCPERGLPPRFVSLAALPFSAFAAGVFQNFFYLPEARSLCAAMHSYGAELPRVYWVPRGVGAVGTEQTRDAAQEHTHPFMFAQFRSVRFECATVAFVDPHTKSQQVMKGSFNAISRHCSLGRIKIDDLGGELVVPQPGESVAHVRYAAATGEDHGRQETQAPRAVLCTHPDRKVPKNKKRKSLSRPWCCLACGATHTPQRRKSSLGPETLCNRCGLLWSKGRLKAVDDESRKISGEYFAPLSPAPVTEEVTAWTEHVWRINDVTQAPERISDERMSISFIAS